jgi:hypothetical protein
VLTASRLPEDPGARPRLQPFLGLLLLDLELRSCVSPLNNDPDRQSDELRKTDEEATHNDLGHGKVGVGSAEIDLSLRDYAYRYPRLDANEVDQLIENDVPISALMEANLGRGLVVDDECAHTIALRAVQQHVASAQTILLRGLHPCKTRLLV